MYMTTLIIFIILTAILAIALVTIIIIFINNRKLWNDRLVQLNTIVSNIPNLSIKDRIEATTNLFSIIDLLVDYELINYRKYDIFIEGNPKRIDIDETLEKVSKLVFESFTMDIYIDKNNIVSKECIMRYIKNKVFVELLAYLNNKSLEAQYVKEG